MCSNLNVSQATNWPDHFGKALQLWSEKSLKPISTLSLFSGVGGLDIGFHDVSFKVKAMVEIDERFVASLQANSGVGKFLETLKFYAWILETTFLMRKGKYILS